MFFCDYATENGAHESGRGCWGLRPTPQIAFRRRHSSKLVFVIDSAPFLNRFGDNFKDLSARDSVLFGNKKDKCLYTCAVAELRLAALKRERERERDIYIYIYIYKYIRIIYYSTVKLSDAYHFDDPINFAATLRFNVTWQGIWLARKNFSATRLQTRIALSRFIEYFKEEHKYMK